MQGAPQGPARSAAAAPRGRPRDPVLDTAILAAAERQLGERGFAGMSIEGVAAAAGTTAPSLRRRYWGKLELAMAVIDSMRVEPLPEAPGEPRADALAILENFRANMLRPNGMALLGTILAEERRRPELLEHFQQRLAEPRRARLRQALARGAQAGHLPAGLDLDAAANLLIGAFYARYIGSRRIPDRWAEQVLGIVWPAGPDDQGGQQSAAGSRAEAG